MVVPLAVHLENMQTTYWEDKEWDADEQAAIATAVAAAPPKTTYLSPVSTLTST